MTVVTRYLWIIIVYLLECYTSCESYRLSVTTVWINATNGCSVYGADKSGELHHSPGTEFNSLNITNGAWIEAHVVYTTFSFEGCFINNLDNRISEFNLTGDVDLVTKCFATCNNSEFAITKTNCYCGTFNTGIARCRDIGYCNTTAGVCGAGNCLCVYKVAPDLNYIHKNTGNCISASVSTQGDTTYRNEDCHNINKYQCGETCRSYSGVNYRASGSWTQGMQQCASSQNKICTTLGLNSQNLWTKFFLFPIKLWEKPKASENFDCVAVQSIKGTATFTIKPCSMHLPAVCESLSISRGNISKQQTPGVLFANNADTNVVSSTSKYMDDHTQQMPILQSININTTTDVSKFVNTVSKILNNQQQMTEIGGSATMHQFTGGAVGISPCQPNFLSAQEKENANTKEPSLSPPVYILIGIIIGVTMETIIIVIALIARRRKNSTDTKTKVYKKEFTEESHNVENKNPVYANDYMSTDVPNSSNEVHIYSEPRN